MFLACFDTKGRRRQICGHDRIKNVSFVVVVSIKNMHNRCSRKLRFIIAIDFFATALSKKKGIVLIL